MTKKERNKEKPAEFLKARLELSQNLTDIGKSPESCEMCGNLASEDHHIIKKAEDAYKFNSDVLNLIRVCRDCHVLFHSHESDKLFAINKDRFIEAMEWLELNDKQVSLGNFDKKLT